MKNFGALFLLMSFSSFASEPSCNDVLSGFSAKIQSSIRELAKLRFDLDRRLVLGEGDMVTRTLRAQYLAKETEILEITQMDRKVLIAHIQTDIKAIQEEANQEAAEKVHQAKVEQERLDGLKTRVTEIGNLNVARAFHAQSTMPNGQIVVTGGDGSIPGKGMLTSIEIIDPTTGKSTPFGDLNEARCDHEQSVLSDDELLVVGGTGTDLVQRDSIELVNLKTGKFKIVGHLKEARSDHTQTVLADGRVMIIGGYGSESKALTSIEVFDPKTGQSEIVGHLKIARAYHSQTILPDGQIVIIGGSDNGTYQKSIELINPQTGSSEVIGELIESRELHTQSVLPDGRIVIAGGNGLTPRAAAVETFDPKTRTSKRISFLALSRGHSQRTLANGKVLLIGGTDRSDPLKSVILLDPDTGKYRELTTLKQTRSGHVQSVLLNDKILIAGGRTDNSQVLSSIEAIHVSLEEEVSLEADE